MIPPISASRRAFISTAATAAAGVWMADSRLAGAQGGPAATPSTPSPKSVDTTWLHIGYEESGPANGFPVVLLHGFPDDVRAYDNVVPALVRAGHRVLVPYLRGHGLTRFRDASKPRMAQQAAIGQDIIDFADALRLPRFAVAGYDWGGRAAAIAGVLAPDRVRAAVLIGGYTVQDTVNPSRPASPEAEYRQWYQWYFNTERGVAGLTENRHALCRLLWHLWSPSWHFSDAEYNRTAVSFDNPDFVDAVIHSYRHRHHYAPGEPRFEATEKRLAAQPPVTAPAITLYGAEDGIRTPPKDPPPEERAALPKLVARRVFDGIGHFMPRERPEAVSSAILELLARE
jgi:pimeloyl-ACP methyl ester carboxylesterase